MSFLILIPLLAVFLIFKITYKYQTSEGNTCWRKSFLASLLFVSVFIVVSTEVLSLLNLISTFSILIVWLSLLIFLTVKFKLYKRNLVPSVSLNKLKINFSTTLIFSLAFISVLLFVVGLYVAPNNGDAMAYHMARVMHWIQNGSVAHYSTMIERQIYMPPFSEFILMHFKLLTGGDRFFFVVQWISMIGSCIGVSLIAKELGAKLNTQILAATISFAIPMGILQTTSTQNSYVVALFIVIAVYLILNSRNKYNYFNILLLAFTIGLAMLTKATAYLFLPLFLLWFFIDIVRSRIDFKSKSVFLLLIFAVVMVINAGHFVRNYKLYNHPIGSPASEANEMINEELSFRVFTSNIIRNSSMHLFQVPRFIGKENVLNYLTFNMKIIKGIHEKLDISTNDKINTESFSGKFFLRDMHIDEYFAGNFLHVYLIIFSLLVLIIFYKRFNDSGKILAIHSICVLSGYLFFCFYLKWHPFNSRLHLPLFVMFSPLVAIVFSRMLNRHVINFFVIVFLFQSLAFIYFNKYNRLFRDVNVLNTPRMTQYFNFNKNIEFMHNEVVKKIESNNDKNIGFILHRHSMEYPLWIMLKELDKDINIYHVNVNNHSKVLYDKSVKYDAFVEYEYEGNYKIHYIDR